MKRNAHATTRATLRAALARVAGMNGRTVGVLALALVALAFALGRWTAPAPAGLEAALAEVRLGILEQQRTLDRLRGEQNREQQALAAQLAKLQAASTRIDALGERLVQLGQLAPEEFDFGREPPVGGPELPVDGPPLVASDLDDGIARLGRTLARQASQLDALQDLLLGRRLERDYTPAGWPVESGWISSRFGERVDPFTGKRTQHNGIDFAGKRGTGVLSVAAGVVIWAGGRTGYGKTVEIDHGNGYVTRYAHNDDVLVAVGDTVTAGQRIGRMGMTGRASSPHVHFEVLKGDVPVNPSLFTKQIR